MHFHSFTRRGILLVSAACFLACGSSHTSHAFRAKPAKAEWTVMYFMDSDNNLELPQMENIAAAARVGGTDNVRVLMMVDRSKLSDEDGGHTNMGILNFKNWEGGKFFEVKKGQLVEIEDMGDVNMGDPDTLVKYVEKASTLAPADKYALIFGDHGGSWPGFDSDGSHDDDSITLTELQSALKSITEKLGRLELVHYDDCLMSCVENAAVVAPYSKWMTASAELVPGDGCDYDTLLKGLTTNPSMDGKELGSLVVSSFNDYYVKSSDPGRKDAAVAITMALIDCDEVGALTKALNELGVQAAQSLKSGREAFIKAAGARSKATEYGRNSAKEPGAGVVDIVDFCRLLQEQFGPSPVGTAAEKVIGQVKQTVIEHINGKGLPQSRGISIYLPTDTEQLSGPGNTYVNTLFAKESGWDKLVAEFNHVKVADKTNPVLDAVKSTASVIKPDGEITFTSKLKADDLDEAYFTLSLPAGDDRIIMGEIPTSVEEGGNLKETWDGKWLYIHNGKDQEICPIDDIQLLDEDKPDGELLALVPLQIQRKSNGEWVDITATFLLDFSDEEAVTGEMVYAFKDSKEGPSEVEFKKGDSIRPVFLVVSKNGDEEYVPAEGADFELKIDDPFDVGVVEDRVPDGDYLMGFRAVDLSGNDTEDFIAVKVAPAVGGR